MFNLIEVQISCRAYLKYQQRYERLFYNRIYKKDSMVNNQISKISIIKIKLTEKQTQRKMDSLDNLGMKFCRICYEESNLSQESASNLIRPCKCMDDVHRSCLLKWANSSTMKYKDNFNNNSYPKCQICCEPLYFEKRNQLVVREKDEIIHSIKRMPSFFVSGLLLILLCLSGLGFLTYVCVFQKCVFSSQSSEIVIIAWIILPIFLFFWIHMLTAHFFIKKIDCYSQILANKPTIDVNIDDQKPFLIKKLSFLNYLPVINIDTLHCFKINRKQ